MDLQPGCRNAQELESIWTAMLHWLCQQRPFNDADCQLQACVYFLQDYNGLHSNYKSLSKSFTLHFSRRPDLN
ncbi:hypothetical protein AV530_009424 [Patagioenas fasciata monilis]|uniref:Uncharacterized protein n=1 Tax=Patagioenas fasciata monilis TaxID=372326 RepID=A0A1V4JJA5_PATFA|nr:hypothetical protein AV530_009424 [Patagioenas fasciata monilis]